MTTATTTATQVATLTIGEGRNGAGKLWLDGHHIFEPANMPAGTRYDVSYASGVVTLTANVDGKKRVHHHSASSNPICDLTNKKIESCLGIGTTVIVTVADGIITATAQQRAWN
jgi:hypothetical protein|tara:strand:+ start:674 stop:1015 length:342 start_codon:yes stop_codon:yes gene_type:complete